MANQIEGTHDLSNKPLGTQHLSEREPELSKNIFRRCCSEVDVYVGRRIKAWREANGFTQPNLAKQIGISFQQLQK